MGMYLIRSAPFRSASRECVPHGMCTSVNVRLMSVYLMGVYLMGVYLMGMYLTRCAPHGRVSLRRASHGRGVC
jgi:hypothetical protein